VRFYRRHMPHWRIEGTQAVYFVTWCLQAGQEVLTPHERDSVVRALRCFEGVRYDLLAFVVMDDHVHVILVPDAARRLESIVHSWKSYTGHQLQRESGRPAPVWLHESFVRVLRDESELHEKAAYVGGNPWKRWPAIREYPWVWVRGQSANERNVTARAGRRDAAVPVDRRDAGPTASHDG